MSGSAIATTWVQLVVETSGIGQSLAKELGSPVTNAADKAGKEAGSTFSSVFGGAVKGIGVGIAAAVGVSIGAIGAIAGKGLSRALNIQDAKAQLTGLGNSAEAVTAIMGSALDSVRGTAFGLDAAATIAASSVAAGIKPGEALTRTLKLTADAATIGKSSLSEMGDMVNKVATNGKLTTEVLNQFQSRGIPLLQMVADQYGVTAAEASKMVTEGKVDFATFQNALESGVGGAALASGATARGAFANIGAAFSRLGALFVGSAVDGAPTLFTSIAGAVDRATTALTPFAGQFSAQVTPAIAALAAWIDTIDFEAVVAKVTRFGSLVGDTFAYIRGYVSGEGANVDIGWLEGPAETIANIIIAIQNAIGSLSTGDFSGAFSSIGSSLQTLAPAFKEFGAELPKIGGAVATVAAAGLTVLTDVLSFLADHVDTIIQFMPLIVAGFIAWRLATSATATASIALRTAELAALPGQILRNGLRLAAATIEYQVAAATRASTTAEVAATGARNGGILANVRAAASTVAARVAMVAGAVATGIATAAQWALNAAMSANPIALVVIAIAALVAGLIWFFTQTELGKEIWAGFVGFLGDAWNAIATGATIVWTAISDFLSGLWEGIVAYVTAYVQALSFVIGAVIAGISAVWNTVWGAVGSFFSTIWQGIVAFATAYINTVSTIISAVVNGISSVWSAVWGGISSFFATIWAAIVTGASIYISTVSNVIGAVINGISSVWSSVWGGISSFFGGIWSGILAVIGNVGAVFGRVFSTVASVVSNAFNGVVSVVKGVINGIIDAVNGAIKGVNSVAGAIGGAIGVNLKVGSIPRLAEGATIQPRSGGTLAVLAEAGKAESVIDAGLPNKVLGAALEMMHSGSGEPGGDSLTLNYTHNGGPGFSDSESLFRAARRLKSRVSTA